MGIAVYANLSVDLGGVLVKLTYQKKRETAGFLFVLPWIIGALLFFVQPVILLMRLAFTDMGFGETGRYVLEPLTNWYDNFRSVLSVDAYFSTYLVGSLGELLYQVPFVVLFSLFSATMLNIKFRGRSLMRTIFFLPVVIGTGLVMNTIDQAEQNITTVAAEGSSMFNTAGLVSLLTMSGLPQEVVDVISTMVTGVADLVWSSAIQTLVFLIALLSVPQSYYEVAEVEGATAWETFWKVTFPTVTPYVLALTIYTVIDSFTNINNKTLNYIATASNANLRFSEAAAMAWLYFIIIVIVILIVFLAFRPFVFQNHVIGSSQKRGVKHGKKR